MREQEKECGKSFFKDRSKGLGHVLKIDQS